MTCWHEGESLRYRFGNLAVMDIFHDRQPGASLDRQARSVSCLQVESGDFIHASHSIRMFDGPAVLKGRGDWNKCATPLLSHR